jgi:hypothetical protein
MKSLLLFFFLNNYSSLHTTYSYFHEINRMETRKVIKDVVVDCLSKTILHAILNFFKTENNILVRILWIISFFISSGFCIYSCIATKQTYYSYNSYN